MSDIRYVVEISPFIFEDRRAYQKLKNSAGSEQTLWLIRKVVEGKIRIADFYKDDFEDDLNLYRKY